MDFAVVEDRKTVPDPTAREKSLLQRMKPDRRWFVVPIALVFLSLLLATHYYVAVRLIWGPVWPAGLVTFLLWGLAFLGTTLILQPLAQRFLPVSLAAWIVWPASVWMGVLFGLLLLLGASELITRPLEALRLLDSTHSVLIARIRAAVVLGILAPLTFWSLRQGLKMPEVKRVEIELTRWPMALNGFRIVQISDIHFTSIRGAGFARSLTRCVNRLTPDLLAVTGDLVDGDAQLLGPELEPLRDLRARLGVYFVTGNHDHYSGPDPWVARVRQLGMDPLRNEHRILGDHDGAAFAIAGVEDHSARHLPGEHAEDLDAALSGIPENCPILLLAHDPATFKAAQKGPVDLQLSGHTHGGQIWPFHYLVRLSIPFVAGLYQRGAAKLYVSRGTGYWGPPMRFGAPAEITEIVLRSPGL